MKRLVGLLLHTILFTSIGFSQSAPDTSEYPYWVDMMADPTVNFFKTQRAFEIYWQNRTIEKGSGYKPFKRWEYNMSQLIDGQGNIPAPGSLEREVEKYLYLRSNPIGSGGMGIGGTIGSGSATCQTTGNWVEIGPDYLPGNRTGQPNGLGRVNGLAFHPKDSNIIYAGAPAGGVWISHDGGQTWATNTDSLATLGVSSIAVDPIHPDTIYLGTGDRDASDSYGRGVFKSTDGGQTWVKINSTMGNVVVGRLIIDPNNTNVLLAATSSGIYRTSNGGSSWTQTQSGNFKDIVFDAVNSQIAYACRTSARLYRTSDNGQNWTQVTNGLPGSKNRMAVAVTPDDSNFVYAVVTNQRTYQGLYLSTDRGNSFSLMSDTPNIMDYSHLGTGTGGQAWYDLDIAVDPTDKSIVYVAGVNIFQSLDSGKTWKINAHWVGSGGAPDVHADNHVMEYQPGTNTLFTGNDGGVYFTRNKGKAWIDISKGLGIAQIYRLGQSATHANTIINGYQDNGTGLYENANWYTVIGGDGMDCVIDPGDVNYAYGALYYGDIRRIKNGYSQGTIAKNGKNGITEQGGWVTPYVLREGTPSTMFVGYKNIWRSTNIKVSSVNSVTWTKISNNVAGSNSQNITALENSPANSDILYVSRSGNKFFKSTNVNAGTPTWTDLTSNLPNNSSVLWIESHPTYQDRVWICQSNKVYQSNDGGSNWTNISSGLPNIPVLSIVFDSSSKYQGMYAGTYMGVFYKDTTMTSWQWYNDNMPINTRVRDIEIYYSPAGRSKSHVVCATYGRGNWKSPLYDEDQQEPDAGFTASATKACMGTTVSYTDTSLYLPTAWLWRFTPNTVTYVNGTDSCSQFPQVVFNATGKYTLKMYAENCMGYDSIEVTDAIEIFPAIKSPVCIPKTTNTTSSAGLGIFGLSMAQYSFPSSGTKDEGGYVDMGCTEIMDLNTDTSYVTDVVTGKNYKEYVKIYIDFNNNGDLDDAGELVYDTYQLTNHQDTIKIPSNAVTGKLIRMRVMSDYNQIQHSCDTLGYGQTEDYGVILDASIPVPDFVIDTNRICTNGYVTLTDSSTGPIYKRRWYMSNGTLTYKSDQDGPITFNLPTPGWYYAELVLNDSIVSKRIDSIVYVSPYPTSNLSIISGASAVCEGASIVFKNTTDQKTAKFAWYKNNTLIGGLDDSVITIGNVALQDSGSYHSTVTFDGCESVATPIKISVYPVPSAEFSLGTVDSCLSKNRFEFNDLSAISSGTLSYSWDFGDGNNSSTSSPTHVYTDTGEYTVRLAVSSLYKCTDTFYRDVRVWSSPTSDFSINNDKQCLKDNDFVFTNMSSIDVGNLSFNWDLGNGNINTSQNNSEQYGSEGTYDITLIATSDKNCSDTTTKQVVVYASPKADFDIITSDSCLADNAFDFDNQSSISSGTIAKHYWDFGDGNTNNAVDNQGYTYAKEGTYIVQLTSESDQGCFDTIQKTVRVHPSPTASFSINDSAQCFNGNLFSMNDLSISGGGTIASYSWDFGDGSSSSASSPGNITYSSDGNYVITLTVTSDQNCASVLSKNVIVHPNPVALFSGGKGCIGKPISFENTSSISNGSISQYEWLFGDGSTDVLQNPTHTYLSAGTYEVKLVVISDKGCKDSMVDKTAATIFAKPNAAFTYTKTGSFDTQTEMEFFAEGASVVSWDWWINNAQVGSGQTYNHIFQDTGTFNIMLWVTNSDGCSDSLVQAIFVFPDASLQVPTSFSPNNDNLNDIFSPKGVRFVQSYKLRIYNRWGNLLFETDNPGLGWDGTYGGAPVPAGQYLVQIETIDFNNEKTKYNGMITVVR